MYVSAALRALVSVLELENVAAEPLTVLTLRLFTVNDRETLTLPE